jgi:DNA repair exonuclease SbcCD ATPase subunit
VTEHIAHPLNHQAAAALGALGDSLTSAARALVELRAGDDDAAAIEAVIQLDDALARLDSFAGEVSDLLALAQAGPSVEEVVRGRADELAAVAERTAAVRSQLELLRGSSQELEARVAEHAQLRQQVAELRRLGLLVVALDELQAQQEVINERLSALAHAGEKERSLTGSAAELLSLTRQRLDLLAPELRRVLEEVDDAQQRLADEEERLGRQKTALAEATGRYEQLRALQEQRAAALQAYARADRELLEGVAALPDPPRDDVDPTGLDQARALLDDVERRLARIDDLLRNSLEAHRRVRDHEQAVLGWSSSS